MAFGAKKPTTLMDVANKAGVSVSTVSKVLKNSEQFKPDTVKIVREAARELNYNPNILARGVVMGGHTPVISFFVPNIMDPFFAEFVDKRCRCRHHREVCAADSRPDFQPGNDGDDRGVRSGDFGGVFDSPALSGLCLDSGYCLWIGEPDGHGVCRGLSVWRADAIARAADRNFSFPSDCRDLSFLCVCCGLQQDGIYPV